MKWIAEWVVVFHVGPLTNHRNGFAAHLNEIIMPIRDRRLLEILVASLLIVAGGACLGAMFKIVMSGSAFPTTQLALMGVGGTLALIAGVALLRRAMANGVVDPVTNADDGAAG
ncbi:hypothetical protein BH11GEM1_BH11GEM1_04850 [soil metagenome]